MDYINCNREERGDFTIRLMIDADVTDIMSIESRVYAYPWTAGIFRDCIGAGYCCYVLEQKSGIIAYAVMSVGINEAHILNICVHPETRGKGYGYALMGKMITLARQLQADTMFLEVRPSNSAARSLYDKLGFNEVGTRRNYYPAEQGRENALILAKHL